jgi:hypothetical protein
MPLGAYMENTANGGDIKAKYSNCCSVFLINSIITFIPPQSLSKFCELLHFLSIFSILPASPLLTSNFTYIPTHYLQSKSTPLQNAYHHSPPLPLSSNRLRNIHPPAHLSSRCRVRIRDLHTHNVFRLRTSRPICNGRNIPSNGSNNR